MGTVTFHSLSQFIVNHIYCYILVRKCIAENKVGLHTILFLSELWRFEREQPGTEKKEKSWII